MKSAKTVALLAATSLLLPGCFLIRGFSFSNWFIPKRGKVVASLKLMPGAPEASRAHVFILIGFPAPDPEPSQVVVTGPRKLDTNGKFGGPFQMVKDNVLESLALGHESCAGFGGAFLANDSAPNHWLLLRTQTRVRTGNKVDKVALTKIGFKPRSPSSGGSLIHMYSGLWRDLAPAGPDSGDEYACLSGVETTLFVGKPEATTTSQAPQWVKDVLY